MEGQKNEVEIHGQTLGLITGEKGGQETKELQQATEYPLNIYVAD